MVLEVQRESSLYQDRDNVRCKRIIFYRRLGAKIFDGVHYLLPNLYGGKPEDMYLMMVPNQDILFVSNEFVFCVNHASLDHHNSLHKIGFSLLLFIS